jgi:acetyltransferase-like isoleucine patch superfamily enzyme
MAAIIDTLLSQLLKMRLAMLKRRQHDRPVLRQIFASRYAIEVGMHSYGCFDRWRMPGPMVVGRYCSIANTVRAALVNHPDAAITTHPVLYERKFGVVDGDIEHPVPLVIEDDVWIGHNAMILPGCKHIGRGAIVGAGAIITRDVAAYTIVAGNPAKVLRTRFAPEMIEAIEKTRWWELEPAALRRIWQTAPALLTAPTAASLARWPQTS